ncbi:MAG: zinc-dependent alcohol dehydrogenase, partial [Candidatus Promineifilaceae bacterium]
MTSTMLEQLSLVFLAPFEVTVERTLLAEPGPGEVQITSSISAISPGTEMLFYRGQVPEAMAVDETITALDGTFSYPLRYGYALVGTVTAVGPGADPSWLGRLVFTFAPHQSHFVIAVENLVPVPEGLAAEDAVLLPFMETAVSFLMDGRPLIGENVVVFGQGVIGLLTVALLASYPLGKLAAIDPIPLRRDWSGRLGAEVALDPAAP